MCAGRRVACSLLLALALLGCTSSRPPPLPTAAHGAPPVDAGIGPRRVIVFIWDGLRADSIDPDRTPVLARLRDDSGVSFREHHAVYPTLTMMNAAAFATGARSSAHGFYGNTLWSPGASGQNASGAEVFFGRPVFTQDHSVLTALDRFAATRGTSLLRVPTLFEAAQAAKLRTAVLGKSGPAFLQDYRQDGSTGVILDEHMAWPRSFALALQAAGLPVPRGSALRSYPEGPLQLAEDNGDPTASTAGIVTLADGLTPDPRAEGGSPHRQKNEYLMRVFLEYVLPQLDPQLSLLWLRDPDSCQHSYGPGSSIALEALRDQDRLLGRLLEALEALGRTDSTDLVIASDHGHSTVASERAVFPPRGLVGPADGRATVGEVMEPGYSVSGEVRSADLLRRAGFEHVYDGLGCVLNPVLGGIRANGEPLYPPLTNAACAGHVHSTGSFDVPAGGALEPDAIVIAANGGSDFCYVPSRDRELVARLVTALQERTQYSAVFVRSAYGALAGTFPLAQVGLEGEDSLFPPTPDVVVSFAFDASAVPAGPGASPGTLQASSFGSRGMHGSFSPIDTRATLIATGPSFRRAFANDYPSSSVDVAPTVAAILGLELPHAQGRVLEEALAGREVEHELEPLVQESSAVTLARVCALDDLDCANPGPAVTYRAELRGQTLTVRGGARYEYHRESRVTRAPP